MFDYVIVGGGSAGCVVAARLAEDPGSRVLLLEAGPDASGIEEVRVPAAYSRLFRSQYDWNYVTLPQERADTRPVYWPSGKVLGAHAGIIHYTVGQRKGLVSGSEEPLYVLALDPRLCGALHVGQLRSVVHTEQLVGVFGGCFVLTRLRRRMRRAAVPCLPSRIR